MRFHIVKRDQLVWWKSWGVRILSVIVGLLVSALVTVVLTGDNPIQVFATMVDGAFGTERRLWTLGQGIAILLCISLAVTPAFKMRFWNIGAEGQALMGGFAAATCMLFLGDKMPTGILLCVIAVSSILAGAIWALIPAYFKARFGTNETLFTLMMNYIAIQIISFFVYKWSNPVGSGKIGVINPDTRAGWFPIIAGKTYLLNILIVAVLTIAMFIYLKYSKHGYEIAVVGESENTARYIGIDVKRVILRTMFLSGALCGITGFLLVCGTDHTITRETIAGRGFTAIMVSWLAKFNPIFMIITSFLLVFFEKGATQISTQFGLNDSFSEIITGIIIFFIIGSEFFLNYKLKRDEKKGVAK
ncbi:MAG: ABC transporter permease [Ruminococcaceae bacterium]|nr:ABC transporter permease [Oscillospiraceae bacterium]